MNTNAVYLTIFLTVIWVILRESFTVFTVASGLVISSGCVYFSNRFLPKTGSSQVSPFRLAIYLIFLLGQIYAAGFSVIKIILTNPHVEIVEVKTQITNKLLRTLLVNSITIVPGSVSLDLKGNTITVLWLTKKTTGYQDTENADELIKGRLEKMLLKAEK